MTGRERLNPLNMTRDQREEEWGKLCVRCGYREANHPVPYAEFYEKDGIKCETVVIE